MWTVGKRVRVLAFVGLLGCAGVFFALRPTRGAAASSTDVPTAVSSVVSSVLPGAASSLLPTGSGSGMVLQVAVPATSATLPGAGSTALLAPAPPSGEGADIIAGELGWKAALVGGLAGLGDSDIVSYQLTEPGHSFTPLEQNYLNDELRPYAGANEYQLFPDVGTVPLSTLTQQLNSNVQVLKSALPPGTITGLQQLIIPVDAGANDYALEVDLKVADLASLQNYEGDLVDGLGTGLVGGLSAPLEGLAINVVDSQGRRAGWWSAERAETGMGISDPVLVASGGSETVMFPDITGGPAPTSFGSGGSTGPAKTAGWPLAPPGGVGPVFIDESKNKVARVLHRPSPPCSSCYRTYHTRRGDLRVRYVKHRVYDIGSTSPDLTLDGMKLGLGPKKLHKALKHWMHFKCQGYQFFETGSGPTTTISFGQAHSVNVDINAATVGGCLGQ